MAFPRVTGYVGGFIVSGTSMVFGGYWCVQYEPTYTLGLLFLIAGSIIASFGIGGGGFTLIPNSYLNIALFLVIVLFFVMFLPLSVLVLIVIVPIAAFSAGKAMAG